MLTRTNVLSFFTLEMHLGCSNQHPKWFEKEDLMINSLVEANTVVVTFEYQHDFIKSAIACGSSEHLFTANPFGL